MARKSLGFIPLLWECPSCGTLNPGPIKTCTSCGAPQPDDVAFKRVDEEKFNFIKDEALIRMAKAGPDIHCPYCGTRNLSSAKLCTNCGGELNMGGKAREAGKRVGSSAETQVRPAAAVPAPKKKLSRTGMIFAAIAIFACIAGFIVLMLMLLKTDDITGTVMDVSWQRAIAVEAYTTVTERDWLDEIPTSADIVACSQEYRYTSDVPVPNATEECSEAYVEDTGTGVGEVVQDCTYRVYDDYCEYTVMDWVVVDTVTEIGQNLSPAWPFLSLADEQREGVRNEDYTITFRGDGETYTYKTTDSTLFMLAEPGSRWNLSVNSFGAVQSIEPAD
ncbi:MAG: zinc ribbon domain-containing protein [Chloroflexota bacterium]|nr:zinc ribbon domain-containing protein [Chloroflexota bacterium]